MTYYAVRQLFEDIEAGLVTVKPTESPAEVFCGDVTYEASNGWRIVVFNDCGDFDYIDHVVAPDGEECHAYLVDAPAEIVDWMQSYRPPDDKVFEIWGLR